MRQDTGQVSIVALFISLDLCLQMHRSFAALERASEGIGLETWDELHSSIDDGLMASRWTRMWVIAALEIMLVSTVGGDRR